MGISAESATVNEFGWLSSSSLNVQGRLRDDSHLQGLPSMNAKMASAHKQWEGYQPGSSRVQQRYTAIGFSRREEASTGQTSLENITPETDPKLPFERGTIDRWIPLELRPHIKNPETIETIGRHP